MIIKVLHIISGNDNGGGGKHVLNLCMNSDNSMKHTICCLGEGFFYDCVCKYKVNVVLFSMKDALLGKLKNYINTNKFDIVNFHGAKAFLIHHFINKKIKVSCVATVHSDYKQDFLNNKLKYYIYTPLSRHGLKSFQNFICVSQYIKSILEEDGYMGSMSVINNGINFQDINLTKSSEEIRKSLGIEKNEFVFTCVARMHPVKNHSALIDAFYSLKEEYKDIKLVLVGDGEIEQQLKHKVKELQLEENVIFTGYRPNPIDYINAGDVSVLVSLSEGGAPPIVILESAAVSKPVICTAVGDMDKMINEETGFLINGSFSSSYIYTSLKKAYESKYKLPYMGNKLHSLFTGKYTMKNFCENYYDFYLKILKRRRSAEKHG